MHAYLLLFGGLALGMFGGWLIGRARVAMLGLILILVAAFGVIAGASNLVVSN